MMHPPGRRTAPVSIRSRMVLELASELIEHVDWPYRRAHITLRARDFEEEGSSFYGSGSPDGIVLVAEGSVGFAMINPSPVLTMAHLGTGPYTRPLPVRAIAIIPDYDQIVFAITAATGLTSMADVREQQYPLRVSIRGPRQNSVPLIANEICKAAGFTLDGIERWGGEVRYDYRLAGLRIEDVGDDQVDALIDEGVTMWADRAVELGMRFLPATAEIREALAPIGLRPGTLAKSQFPGLEADVDAIDFSGFPLFTHADVPDAHVRMICEALEARRASIPWEGEGPLPLNLMCRSTKDGPLEVPMHPAAEAYWRERGFLGE